MATAEPTILAIDLGTSGPKVALMSASGAILGCTSHPTTLHLPSAGGAEQDPEQWWSAIVSAAQELHALGLADPASITAVCVTSQWAGTVPVDANGKALHNAIIWMDTRGAPDVQELTGGLISVEGYGARKLAKWIRRTGGVPSRAGKEPVAHILYLRRTQPEIYAATHKFLEPKDYINLRLTGEFAASFDSIALHWVTDNRDINKVVYDSDLLALSTLPRAKLPDLKRSTDVLGTVRAEIADQLRISPKAKVIMGTPDVQSAAVGSGAVRDREGHIYLGTSSWVTCHVNFKKTDLFRNMASLPSALPGRYFVATAQETAGACINWLRDNIIFGAASLSGQPAPQDFYAHIDQLAGSVPPGSDKTIFTPWLIGERAPVSDATIRGAFFNQSLSTTGAHLVRAVFEGVAFNTRWLARAVDRFVGQPLTPLRMIGGGASSDLWCQVHADVLDREIDQVQNPVECNARGAGLVAALALDYLCVQDIPKCVAIKRRFSPRPEYRALYDELFTAYVDLYKATKGICARLNAISQ